MEVYHYTSEEGVMAITTSGYIQQSQLSTHDAFYGAGVYLTTLPPSVGRMKIAQNNWGRGGDYMEDVGRVDRAIKLIIPGHKLKMAHAANRDILVHPGNIYLANCSGYEVFRLDQGGSEESGSEESGSEEAGSEEAGSEEAGSEEAGSEEAGSEEAGSEERESEEAGSEEAGSEEAGSEEAGSVERESDEDEGCIIL